MKVLISSTLLVALLLVTFDTGLAATTNSKLNELTQKSNDLQKAIEAKKKEAEEKKKQAAEKERVKKQYEAAATKLEADIKATEGRITQTENKVNDTQKAIEGEIQKISLKEQEIAQKKEEINESAAELFMAQNSSSNLLAVVASPSIGSALNQVAALSGLSDKLIDDATQLDKQREELLAIKAQLEQQRQDLENQKKQLAAYQRALDSQKQQKIVLAGEAESAQKQLSAQAQEAIKVSEDLRKQFAAVANEVAAMRRAASKSTRATASRSNATSALGFTWPLDGAITTYFGGSTPFQRFHTGLDIAGPAGDPVVASNSGVVTVSTKMCCSDYSNTVDKSYGYGNWVEIKHDNGYVSRYGHLMEMLVSPGQRVERAQTIGYRGGARGMAGAGWSTGPHLHFEVWDSEGPFDPFSVLP